jgi:hypothetical protein
MGVGILIRGEDERKSGPWTQLELHGKVRRSAGEIREWRSA